MAKFVSMQWKPTLLFLVCFLTFTSIHAQNINPVNGVQTPTHTIYAFTNATLVISPSNTVENGILVIQDGKIIASGSNVTIPHNAVVYDLNGKYIYPSFIELNSNYGMPEVPKRTSVKGSKYISQNNGLTYWNDAIHPQLEASKLFNYDAKKAVELRELGFGISLSHQKNGIMRGNAVLVTLGENYRGSAIVKSNGAAFYGFGKGNSSQTYPTSLMGSIALLRQANYDSEWYSKSEKMPINYSLQAIEKIKNYRSFLMLEIIKLF